MTHDKKSDAQIDLDVLQELAWDTRVNESNIDVQTSGGVVTLQGTVDSWAERLAAQEAAHRVPGVLDVANDITVTLRGWDGRTDSEIAHAVRHALEWDVSVPDDRVHSTVTGGVVTLEGSVTWASQRHDAARCIRNLGGVREVQNHIVLQPPAISTESLRGTIHAALERHAAHVSNHVRVHVHDGVITLTGEVPSRSERDAVVGAVAGTSGVRRVEDQLHVRGSPGIAIGS